MNAADALDGFITAGEKTSTVIVWIVEFILLIGPGCVVCFAAWLCVWAWDKNDARRARRRGRGPRAIEGLEQLEAELDATWQRLQAEAREEETP